MSDFSRRKFLKTGAAALAGITIAPSSILGMSHGHVSPTDVYKRQNEYKKFNIDSAIHYVDRNLEIARQLNRNYLKYQSSLQLSLVYSMCGRYRDAELLLEKMKPSELPRSLLATYYDTYARFWEYYSISATNNQ